MMWLLLRSLVSLGGGKKRLNWWAHSGVEKPPLLTWRRILG